MAKTQTSPTLSPYRLATGHGIFFEDAQIVAEGLNHVFGYTPSTHVSLITGGRGWGGTSTYGDGEPATHDLEFPTSAGWSEAYRFSIWIDADDDVLTLEATCAFTGTDSGQVRFTVGSASAVTLSGFTAGTTSTDSSTVNVSSTGTGIQSVLVEINHTTGTAAEQELQAIRIESNPITSSLPDPPNE